MEIYNRKESSLVFGLDAANMQLLSLRGWFSSSAWSPAKASIKKDPQKVLMERIYYIPSRSHQGKAPQKCCLVYRNTYNWFKWNSKEFIK